MDDIGTIAVGSLGAASFGDKVGIHSDYLVEEYMQRPAIATLC